LSSSGERGGFAHQPVMSDEVVSLLAEVPAGVIVDATIGGGGHAAAILEALPACLLLGIDRDVTAVEAARSRLSGFAGRAEVVHGRFDRLASIFAGSALATRLPCCVAVLFDLGVSSPQLDRPERGFSFQQEGPLDMRMDLGDALTAAEICNTYPAAALEALFRANGEERLARQLSHAIVSARPLATTADLAAAVEAVTSRRARERRGHPATRVFQALRIEVNAELACLRGGLGSALELLAPTGRCVVISYHSGEDRLVKEVFATAASGGCTCPPHLPCVCGAIAEVTVLTRGARLATKAEVAANPRARSARLRAVERLGADANGSRR
jgi:16S rRNA (cytosine1402-N4)-methyltransferase